MKRLIFSACLLGGLCAAPQAQAQSWKDLLKKENIEKVVQTLADKKQVNLTGTWQYAGSALELESDKVLNKAGAAVAAAAAEKKLNERLTRYGFQEGKFSFTFHADSTFQTKLNNRVMDGQYSYNDSTQMLHLQFNRLMHLHAKVKATSTDMDLLFNSDKLLKLITFLSAKSKSATLKGISALSENYDGMNLGFALKKEITAEEKAGATAAPAQKPRKKLFP